MLPSLMVKRFVIQIAHYITGLFFEWVAVNIQKRIPVIFRKLRNFVVIYELFVCEMTFFQWMQGHYRI